MHQPPRHLADGHEYTTVRVIHRDHRGTLSVVKSKTSEMEFLRQEILYTRFSPRERRAIEADIKAIMSLAHPYIAPVVDFYTDKSHESYNIITETPSFQTAADLIEFSRNNNTFIPEESVWCLAGQILTALLYCHLPCKSEYSPKFSRSVILHRNIRPSSILVLGERAYKLTSFGVCYFRKDVVASQATLSLYMAPEVILRNAYNEKSDVWELGVVLYELCAKQRPFSGHDRQQIKDAVINACIRNLPVYYSEDLANFIYSMLIPDVFERPSISDLLAHPKLFGTTQEYDTTIKNYSPAQLEALLQLRTREVQALKLSEAHLKTLLARSMSASENNAAMYTNLYERFPTQMTPTRFSSISKDSRGLKDLDLPVNALSSKFTEQPQSISDRNHELERLQKENLQLNELFSSQSQKHEEELYEMQRTVTDLLIDSQEVEKHTGKTLLMKAAEAGLVYIIERFISQQKCQRDNCGRTALMYAVLGGSIKCVKLLLSAEARMQDSQGKTALAYAIANKDVELISILRDSEWDIAIQNRISIRDLALATQREDIIDLFPEQMFISNRRASNRPLSAMQSLNEVGHNSSNLMGDIAMGSKDTNLFSSQDDVYDTTDTKIGLNKVKSDGSTNLPTKSYFEPSPYSSASSISAETFLN